MIAKFTAWRLARQAALPRGKSWMLRVICSGLCCLLSTGICAPENAVELIGHRGSSYTAPENTLASANLAWQEKADAVEIDIHLSKDGKLMLSHDGNVKRTSGVDINISDATFTVLRRLDVGSWKSSDYAGERMPTLQEALSTIPIGRKLFIEIKCDKKAVPVLQRVLDVSGRRKQVVIIGFDLDTMAAAKAAMPDVPVYWLSGSPVDENMIASVKENKLNGLDLHYSVITADAVKAIKAAGLGLYAWTVNDPVEAARLVSLGVDGITTDRPGWLRNELK